MPDDIPPPVKKIKNEPEDTEEEKLRKKQNDELYAVQDQISILEKKELIAILEKNHQQVPSGASNVSYCNTYTYCRDISILFFIIKLHITTNVSIYYVTSISITDLEPSVRYIIFWSFGALSTM